MLLLRRLAAQREALHMLQRRSTPRTAAKMGYVRMRLTTEQSYALLAKHGCYITEICDRCGKGLGPIRYTRGGDSSVWCSRACRGDEQRQRIRKGGRPRKYKTEAARQQVERVQNAKRQRCFRARTQRNGKPPRIFSETKELQQQKTALSHDPLSEAIGGLSR